MARYLTFRWCNRYIVAVLFQYNSSKMPWHLFITGPYDCSANLIGFALFICLTSQQKIGQVDEHHHGLLRNGWPTAHSHTSPKPGCSTSTPATPLFVEFSHKVLHELMPFLSSPSPGLCTQWTRGMSVFLGKPSLVLWYTHKNSLILWYNNKKSNREQITGDC